MTDREVAEGAVRRAGELLRDGFGADHEVHRKSAAGADVVSAADRAAEAAVVAVLREQRPADGILGEEGARVEAERTWLIDALDGTFNYVSGVPHWCAAVALTDARGPLAGAVYDPVAGELFSAARREGAGGLEVRTGRPLRSALVSQVLAGGWHVAGAPELVDALGELLGATRT
ncbi:MAG TPA: inositol monophosphatase family protein [Solirubrobacteraceae bacterium]